MIVVSISCITYNHAPYIRECLDGFLMQKCNFEFEILIHDDASTDGTQDIIKEYQQKHPNIIKPIFQTENQYSKGQRGMNIKYNFPRAKGKYIALCEGDDYWTDPLKLQKQVDFLEEHKEYGLVHTQIKYLTVIDKKIKASTTDRSNNSFNQLIYKNNIATLTTLMRKECLDKYVNDVNPQSQKNWIAGDLPIWLWFSINSKIYFLNNITSVYRVIPGSVSNTLTSSKYLEFIKSRFYIKEYFIKKYNQDINLLEYIHLDFLKDAEFHAIKQKDLNTIKDLKLKYKKSNKLKYIYFKILYHNNYFYQFQFNLYRLFNKIFAKKKQYKI